MAGKQGGKGRKHGRNFRIRNSPIRTTGSVTRYRADHGIPDGPRKRNHAQGICPLHSNKQASVV